MDRNLRAYSVIDGRLAVVKNGVVKEVYNGYIRVKVYKTSCGKCQTCTEEGRGVEEIDIKTKGHFQVGDPVRFEIEDKSIFGMGILVYIVPVFFFFGGYFVASLFGVGEGGSILVSFLSMALCFMAIHLFDKYLGEKFLNRKIKIK